MATLPAILSCVEDKFKEDLASLHKNLSVALRVVSSKDDVVIDQYVDLLRETSMLLATKFTWAKVNYTLHGVIHHSGDLIAMNGGKGLGSLSEEALEANNKFIRRFLEQFSRKTSPDLQLEDCLARLLERSDPYILERKLNFRPNGKGCSECGSRKHSSRLHVKTMELDCYDLLVHEILVDSI